MARKKSAKLNEKFPGIIKEPEIREEDGLVLPPAGEIAGLGHDLTAKQVAFLQAYSGCLDMKQAIREAGYAESNVSDTEQRLINNPWIRSEIEEINRRYKLKWKMNADMTAAKHIELMEKMEKAFDAGDTKLANSLAKMSETALKATGQLDKDIGSKVSPVTVKINIGSASNDTIIDAEVVDD